METVHKDEFPPPSNVHEIDHSDKAGHHNISAEIDDEYSDKLRRDNIPTLSKAVSEKQLSDSIIVETKGWGVRHTLCFLLWLGSCAAFLSRASLSIAIVSMVSSNQTNAYSNDSEVCPLPSNGNSSNSEATTVGEFAWDEKTQGVILGCFYYGYLVSNFLGGIATEYLGGRLMMTVTVLGSSVLSMLLPLCAHTSLGLLIAVRVLAGLVQGPMMASMYSLMATWIPPQERAKLCALSLTGGYVGTIISMALGGLMIGSNFLGGWPSVFYVFGFTGVLWTVPWLLLVRNRPEEHPSVSDAELSFIRANASTLKRAEMVKIPWLSIATSMPFWSLIAISWGNNFGFYNLLTEIPTYLKNIQHYGIENNGLISALPYIIAFAFSIVWGHIADNLIHSKKLSVLQVRKLSSSIAMFGPVIGLIVICFADCNSTLAVACLCFSQGVNAASNCGGDISEQDIAPNLAGALKGITNTVGSLTGILAPLITGAITSGNQTLSAWRTVFSISALTYALCCIFYLIFGTDKVQPWNEPKEKGTKLWILIGLQRTHSGSVELTETPQ